MPLPIIAGVTRVAFIWSSPDYARRAVNVMHFRNGGDDGPTLAGKIDSKVTTNMWAQTKSSSAVLELHLTPLDGTTASYVFVTGSPAKWKGPTGSGDTIAQACTLIKLTTLQRGRSYRGRVFLPWVSEVSAAAGIYNSTDQSNQQTAWNTFLSDMSGLSRKLVVASYTASAATDVSQITVERDLATQRRRQPRT